MSDRLPRSAYPAGYYPPGPKAYERLNLARARLHVNVITGNQGRLAMQRLVAEWGYPQRTITRATTAFGSFYVIQLGGDRDAGTVTLLGTCGPMVVRLGDTARHRILPPTRTEALLAAVAAEYPATSVTATLAEALTRVLDLCDYYRSTDAPDIPWRAIEAVLAAPLRAHIEAWDTTRADDPTHPSTTTTKADAT